MSAKDWKEPIVSISKEANGLADKIVAVQREWLNEEPPTVSGTQNFITAILPLLNQAIKELRSFEQVTREARLDEAKWWHDFHCGERHKDEHCLCCQRMSELEAQS